MSLSVNSKVSSGISRANSEVKEEGVKSFSSSISDSLPTPSKLLSKTLSALSDLGTAVKNLFSKSEEIDLSSRDATVDRELGDSTREGMFGFTKETNNTVTSGGTNGLSWGAWGAEKVMDTGEVGVAGAAGVHAAVVALSTVVGATYVAFGAIEAYQANGCANRAVGLDNAHSEISSNKEISQMLNNPNPSDHDKEMKESIQNLMDAAQFCSKSNAERATDLKVGACVDTMIGATAMAATFTGGGFGTTGLAAIGTFLVGTAVKVGLSLFRGSQRTEEMDAKRAQIKETISSSVFKLQMNVEAMKVNESHSMSLEDKAMIMLLKGAGLVSKDINIDALTEKDMSDISAIGKGDIEKKFTQATASITWGDIKEGANSAKGQVKSALSSIGGFVSNLVNGGSPEQTYAPAA